MADLALGGERPREMWENGNIDIAPISPLPRGNCVGRKITNYPIEELF